jgi:hypothetical protein
VITPICPASWEMVSIVMLASDLIQHARDGCHIVQGENQPGTAGHPDQRPFHTDLISA